MYLSIYISVWKPVLNGSVISIDIGTTPQFPEAVGDFYLHQGKYQLLAYHDRREITYITPRAQ